MRNRDEKIDLLRELPLFAGAHLRELRHDGHCGCGDESDIPERERGAAGTEEPDAVARPPHLPDEVIDLRRVGAG